jgi:hypothetical protein
MGKKSELWKESSRCHGTASRPRPVPGKSDSVPITMGDSEDCSKCKGRGKVLTEEGRAAKEELDEVGF